MLSIGSLKRYARVTLTSRISGTGGSGSGVGTGGSGSGVGTEGSGSGIGDELGAGLGAGVGDGLGAGAEVISPLPILV